MDQLSQKGKVGGGNLVEKSKQVVISKIGFQFRCRKEEFFLVGSEVQEKILFVKFKNCVRMFRDEGALHQ